MTRLLEALQTFLELLGSLLDLDGSDDETPEGEGMSAVCMPLVGHDSTLGYAAICGECGWSGDAHLIGDESAPNWEAIWDAEVHNTEKHGNDI